ncbi:capsular biosynthesis protein [Aurantimonas aggregata]|uniref:protein-tyrosine-phosphatase n=2 Tax=Aurantimonas aggregata TaxID=2047720 RepID=A0A6L9MNX6_9HYPH|nr:capsular biosynthesis protein [Aurantimonas aggregata]
MSIAMARMAVADGIEVMACTPHIVPGVYPNEPADIRVRVNELQALLIEQQIPLELVVGADVHISPDLLQRMQGEAPPVLNGSRYFLFEPPHHVLPPRLLDFCASLIAAGFTPILTHPERLTWVKGHFGVIRALAARGVLMQLTAGSLTGNFGRSAQRLSDQILDEGLCDVIASDAHNLTSRPPVLSLARSTVSQRFGDAEAEKMFVSRPRAILRSEDVERSLAVPGAVRHTPLRRLMKMMARA